MNARHTHLFLPALKFGRSEWLFSQICLSYIPIQYAIPLRERQTDRESERRGFGITFVITYVPAKY